VAHREDDEELRSEPHALAGEPPDFVMIILRREMAVELLNALITSLGAVPGPSSGKAGVFEQAGESTIGSDR